MHSFQAQGTPRPGFFGQYQELNIDMHSVLPQVIFTTSLIFFNSSGGKCTNRNDNLRKSKNAVQSVTMQGFYYQTLDRRLLWSRHGASHTLRENESRRKREKVILPNPCSSNQAGALKSRAYCQPPASPYRAKMNGHSNQSGRTDHS